MEGKMIGILEEKKGVEKRKEVRSKKVLGVGNS